MKKRKREERGTRSDTNDINAWKGQMKRKRKLKEELCEQVRDGKINVQVERG